MKKDILCLCGLITFCLLITTGLYAQKLLNVQEKSMRVPANLKIDGKATEVNNQFQAYNSATDVYYSLSNDDTNLYLIVQATNPRIIEKILHVGLTFIVNNKGNKSDNAIENVAVTYPLIEPQPVQYIIKLAGAKAKSNVQWPSNPRSTLALDTDNVSVLTTTDAFRANANKLIQANGKQIKIKGVKELKDTLISVYNEEAISAAAAFDNKSAYTYELAIPLKYLGISINEPQKFSYGIRIASRLEERKEHTHTRYVYTHPGIVDVDADLNSTTNFWGEYTLAKK